MPSGRRGPAQAAADSMLALSDDGEHSLPRERCVSGAARMAALVLENDRERLAGMVDRAVSALARADSDMPKPHAGMAWGFERGR